MTRLIYFRNKFQNVINQEKLLIILITIIIAFDRD